MSKAYETVERHGRVREVNRLRVGDTEGVTAESEAGDADVVRDDVTGDMASAVSDLELLLGVRERRRAGGTEEGMRTLATDSMSITWFTQYVVV